MCVFHVTSFSQSFSEFLKSSSLPIYQSHEKEDVALRTKRTFHIEYGFSCHVSKREWVDFAGQIDDAYKFLVQYEEELRILINTIEVTYMTLDFPIECRHSEEVFAQCDYMPPKFLQLAGDLGIGIELSYYPSTKDTKKNIIKAKLKKLFKL